LVEEVLYWKDENIESLGFWFLRLLESQQGWDARYLIGCLSLTLNIKSGTIFRCPRST
jgi:hypothetical protein